MTDTVYIYDHGECSTFIQHAHDVIVCCHRFYTPTLFICVNCIGIVVRCCCCHRRRSRLCRCHTSYFHISIIYSSSSSTYLLVSELYMLLFQVEWWWWDCFSAHCCCGCCFYFCLWTVSALFQFTIECFIIFPKDKSYHSRARVMCVHVCVYE